MALSIPRDNHEKAGTHPNSQHYATSEAIMSIVDQIHARGLQTANEVYVYLEKTVEGKRVKQDIITRLCEIHEIEKHQAQLLWNKIVEEKLFAIALLAEIAKEMKEQLKTYQAESADYYQNKIQEEQLQFREQEKKEAMARAQELEAALACAIDVIHSQIMQYHDDMLIPLMHEYNALVERTEKEDASIQAYYDSIDDTFTDLESTDENSDLFNQLETQQQILQQQVKEESPYNNPLLPGFAQTNSTLSFRLSFVNQLMSKIENEDKKLVKHQGQYYLIAKDQDINTLSAIQKEETRISSALMRNNPNQHRFEAMEQLSLSRNQMMLSRDKDYAAIHDKAKVVQLAGDILKLQSTLLHAEASRISSPRLTQRANDFKSLDQSVFPNSPIVAHIISQLEKLKPELGSPYASADSLPSMNRF